MTISRYLRLVPLALLAAMGLDLADADCVGGSRARGAACASLHDESLAEATPGGDCACCVLSEVAAVAVHAGVAEVPAPAPAERSRPTCAGVRSVPYRPPLSLA